MKRLYIYIGVFVMALSALTACTSDTLPDNATEELAGSLVPLRISVDDIVDITTRSAAGVLPGDALSPDARLGIFVMYERDFDSLAVGSDYHNVSYYYDNVECALDGHGNLCPLDGGQLFYPMGVDSKIAIFAYSPYDSLMTRQRLLNPKGIVGVAADQGTEESVVANDLLLGTPVAGNPLGRPSGHDGRGGDVRLNLRHQRCRIVLDFTLEEIFGLIGAESLPAVDSLYVYAENVPLDTPAGYSLDNAMTDFALPDTIHRDTVLMSTLVETGGLDAMKVRYTSMAIVMPTVLPAEISFRLLLVSGTEHREIRLRTKETVAFGRGTSVRFSIKDDNEEEPEPDTDEIPLDPEGSNPAASRKYSLHL